MTTSIAGSECTHQPQFVSDMTVVSTCKPKNNPACGANNSQCQVRKTHCQFDILWIEVRYLTATNPTWYSFKDNLKGFDWKYSADATEVSFPYSNDDFTEFWFLRSLTSGGHKWIRVLKENAIPETPTGSYKAKVISSHEQSTPIDFIWDLKKTDFVFPGHDQTSSKFAPMIGNQNTEYGKSLNGATDVYYLEGGPTEAQDDTGVSWKDGTSIVLINAGKKKCTTDPKASWTWPDRTTPTSSACQQKHIFGMS